VSSWEGDSAGLGKEEDANQEQIPTPAPVVVVEQSPVVLVERFVVPSPRQSSSPIPQCLPLPHLLPS